MQAQQKAAAAMRTNIKTAEGTIKEAGVSVFMLCVCFRPIFSGVCRHLLVRGRLAWCVTCCCYTLCCYTFRCI